MENIDKILKEATSNITVENKVLEKKELLIIKEALLNNNKSFLKNLYDMEKENGTGNKRK